VSAGNALAGAYFADGHAVAAVTLSAPHLLARLRPLVAEGADRAAVLRAAQPLDLVPVQPAGAGR
jgi:electron transfer flavoprotein alpha/beta subunit